MLPELMIHYIFDRVFRNSQPPCPQGKEISLKVPAWSLTDIKILLSIVIATHTAAFTCLLFFITVFPSKSFCNLLHDRQVRNSTICKVSFEQGQGAGFFYAASCSVGTWAFSYDIKRPEREAVR
jgi:hypothetical protein